MPLWKTRSKTFKDTIAPTVPSNVVATALSPVSVRVTWNAIVQGIGIQMREEGLAMVTDENGVFTFCSVPTDIDITLRGSLGERESEPVGLGVGAEMETVVAQIVLPDTTER